MKANVISGKLELFAETEEDKKILSDIVEQRTGRMVALSLADVKAQSKIVTSLSLEP